MSRHQDFQRIYIEFGDYYKDAVKGEREYYDWLHALSLDESKPYGYSRESFKWAKTMLKFLKEDAENKYYGIIVGLPLMSMNGNIYRERDLIAAALSLKGKHPSLNHKDEFWFNESNRYGVLTVEDAKYEDGAVEAVLKVPKNAVCPICNGAKMTDLIDKQHIINVSLEGKNNGAFEFTDPPFTLLTSDVLPGIPLARIKPLEQIVSEAFNSTKSTGNKKNMKIQPKITEETANSKVNVHSSNPDFRGEWGTPVTSDALIDSQNDLAKTAVGNPAASDNLKMQSGGAYADGTNKEINREAADSDPALECPMGTKMNPDTGKCEPTDEMPMESAEPKGVPATTAGPTKDTSMPKEDDGFAGPSRSKPPTFSAPDAGAFPSTKAGKYATSLHNTVAGTTPFEELTEAKVAQIRAETHEAIARDETEKLKESIGKVEAIWTERYAKLDKERSTLQANNLSQEQIIKEQQTAIRNEQLRCEDIRVEMRELKNQFADITTVSNKFQHLTEDLKLQNADVTKKYQNGLHNNLELSQKLTQANEEYLALAKNKDELEEKLGHARNLAKKLTKIQI